MIISLNFPSLSPQPQILPCCRVHIGIASLSLSLSLIRRGCVCSARIMCLCMHRFVVVRHYSRIDIHTQTHKNPLTARPFMRVSMCVCTHEFLVISIYHALNVLHVRMEMILAHQQQQPIHTTCHYHTTSGRCFTALRFLSMIIISFYCYIPVICVCESVCVWLRTFESQICEHIFLVLLLLFLLLYNAYCGACLLSAGVFSEQ